MNLHPLYDRQMSNDAFIKFRGRSAWPSHALLTGVAAAAAAEFRHDHATVV